MAALSSYLFSLDRSYVEFCRGIFFLQIAHPRVTVYVQREQFAKFVLGIGHSGVGDLNSYPIGHTSAKQNVLLVGNLCRLYIGMQT